MKKCCDTCLTSCITCDNAILDNYIDNGYEITGEPIICGYKDDEYHREIMKNFESCEDFKCRYK